MVILGQVGSTGMAVANILACYSEKSLLMNLTISRNHHSVWGALAKD